MSRGPLEDRHRGAYVLDRGEWTATCRACGYRVSDPDRRQVASQFRTHIRDVTLAAKAEADAQSKKGEAGPIAASS